MRDILALEREARPWCPASDVMPGAVLDEYDVPLTGFLSGPAMTFLFTNILGDSSPTGLWAYVQVSDDEIMTLLAASGPEMFDDAVEAALGSKRVTVAVAFQYGLAHWSTFDSGTEGSLGLVRRFQRRLDLQIKEAERGAQDLAREVDLAATGQ